MYSTPHLRGSVGERGIRAPPMASVQGSRHGDHPSPCPLPQGERANDVLSFSFTCVLPPHLRGRVGERGIRAPTMASVPSCGQMDHPSPCPLPQGERVNDTLTFSFTCVLHPHLRERVGERGIRAPPMASVPGSGQMDHPSPYPLPQGERVNDVLTFSFTLCTPSPLAGEGRGEGDQGSTHGLGPWLWPNGSPLSLPSPARGEGEFHAGARPILHVTPQSTNANSFKFKITRQALARPYSRACSARACCSTGVGDRPRARRQAKAACSPRSPAPSTRIAR